MARRKRQFTDMRDGAGFVKISPFIDRKVYEYAANLLGSSYLKSKPREVFDFLKDLAGEKLMSEILRRCFIEDRGPDAEISPSMNSADFGDFRLHQ